MADLRKPFFVIPLNLGTLASGNVASGYAIAHLNRLKAAALAWRSSGNSNLWARGDFGATRQVDFCALMAANAQAGTTIRLRLGTTQAEVDGTAPYDSGATTLINPAITREDGLYHSHLEIPSVQNARWWRIDIGGHTGDFQAASLVLGKRAASTYLYNQDFEYGVEDFGSMDITRFGVMDEEPGVIMRSLGFTLGWTTEAEFEATFRPMIEKLGGRGMVYVCFSPEATVNRQARTYLGVMRKPPTARAIRKPFTFSQEFEIISPY